MISLITIFYIDTYVYSIVDVYELLQMDLIKLNKIYHHDTQFRVSDWINNIKFHICAKMEKLGSIIIHPLTMTYDYIPYSLDSEYSTTQCLNINCIDPVYKNEMIKLPMQGETIRFKVRLSTTNNSSHGKLILTFSTVTPLNIQIGICLIQMIITNIYPINIFTEWLGQKPAQMTFNHLWLE